MRGRTSSRGRAQASALSPSASRDPLPERPLRDGDPEKERAARDDRRVQSRPATEGGEGKEEREDDEAEPRQRQQRPACARVGQRNRQADRREESVRRT